jgi:hypothetical protein
MAKKFKVRSVFDLSHVPLTPVKREENYDRTLADYNRRLTSEETAKSAAREAELLRVQKDSSRLLAECLSVSAPLQSKFWSQSSLDRIKAHLRDDENFDNLFLPTSDEAVDSNVVYDVIQKFLDDLVFEQGVSLGEISRRRFGLYVASQLNAGVVVDSASLAVMFKRCFDLSIFKDDGDSEFVEHFRAEPPVKQPSIERPVEQPRRATMDDLMNADESTREGRREAHRISESLYIEEMIPVATAWVESIQKFWGFSPTPDDLRRVSRWFDVNGLNRLLPQNYDLARLWLIKNGYWPTSCRTSVEALNEEVEQMDLTRMTFEERRALNIRRRAAMDADISRFGHSQ